MAQTFKYRGIRLEVQLVMSLQSINSIYFVKTKHRFLFDLPLQIKSCATQLITIWDRGATLPSTGQDLGLLDIIAMMFDRVESFATLSSIP